MNKSLRIGIDVGGTNTDLVLLDRKNTVLLSTKITAQKGVFQGIQQALALAFNKLKEQKANLDCICIGTTHATNALLEGKNLLKIGVLRIGSTMKKALPPAYTFPKHLQSLICGVKTIRGGHYIDGRKIEPLVLEEAEIAISDLIKFGAQGIAICGTFSPLYPEQENLIAQYIQKKHPTIAITCSHVVGGIGFLSRENSTICNTALQKILRETFEYLQTYIQRTYNTTCPLYFVQNNGTTISFEEAFTNPITTIAAGPANSLMGGSLLQQEYPNAIIVDIGGTSTDIGCIKDGHPKQSFNGNAIGGITLSTTMADLISLSIGGGSVITFNKNYENILIGPDSIARALPEKAMAFGGSTLTLFDCAVKMNLIPELSEQTVSISPMLADKVLFHTAEVIVKQLKQLQLQVPNAPIIVVGGSSFLAHYLQKLQPKEKYIIPKQGATANAFGAACARISGSIDETVSLQNQETAIERLAQKAIKKACAAGACPKTITIVSTEIIPYGYSTDAKARVLITAAGTIF